jgi:tetratricopeptide (TPR) repeat protein
MAQISLRLYDREIESLIDRGQIDEAIAHSKHILRIYPKHIDTYRLLGKCYLESQRYIEAADILQRVLTVFPDDFISHIGMSIICEDENNLEKAIWHMERALEIQPSNSAVNSELRRLLTAKEGAEPSKVHLSQGAYIRMCVKSGLHEQAIAEAKSALSKEPQRVDLEVILARMYAELGQKPNAIDQITIILNKIPFCYEANMLMVQILDSTNRSEESITYRQRLISLDPYFAFVNSEFPSADLVPDDSVELEKIEWQYSDDDTQRHTKILGNDWQDAKGPLASSGVITKSFNQDTLPAELPDENMIPAVDDLVAAGLAADFAKRQIDATEEEKTQEIAELNQVPEPIPETEIPVAPELVTEIPAPPLPNAQAELTIEPEQVMESQEIPDWMKAAGWVQSSGDTQEETTASSLEPADSPQTAEIPEWIKSMAPVEPEPTEMQKSEESEKIDLLNKILPQNEQPVQEELTESLINDEIMTPIPEEVPVAIEEAESPTSPEISGSVTTPEPEKEKVVPDWLQMASVAAVNPSQPESESPEIAPLPIWMSVGEEIEEEKLPFPDQKSLASQSELIDEGVPSGGVEDLPDWLASEQNRNLESVSGVNSYEPVVGSAENTPISPDVYMDQNPPSVSGMDWSKPELSSEQMFAPIPGEEIPEWLREEESNVGENPILIDESLSKADQNEVIESNAPGMSTPEQAESEIPDWLKEVNTDQSPVFALGEEDILPEWAKPAPSSEPQPQVTPENALETFIASAVIPELNQENLYKPEEEKPPEVVSDFTEVEPVRSEPVESTGLDSLLDQLSLGGYSYGAASESIETPVTQDEETKQQPTSFSSEEGLIYSNEIVDNAVFTDEEEDFRGDETLVSKPFVDIEKPITPDQLETAPQEELNAPETEISAVEPEDVDLSERIATFDSDLGQVPAQVETIPQDLIEKPVLDQEIQDDTLDITTDTDIESWLNSLPEVTPPVAAQIPEQNEKEPAASFLEFGVETTPEEITSSLPTPQSPADTAPLVGFDDEITKVAASPLDELEEAGHFQGLSKLQEVVETIETKSVSEPEPEITPLPQIHLEEATREVVAKVPETYEELLDYANSSVVDGNLEKAVELFSKLIKSGKNLDETIQSLRSAIYRYPSEVSIWQSLGDGYSKENRLQEALEAYTKAEELLQ